MQIGQRRHTNPRCADLHPCADHRIEHPRRNDDYYAGRRLDVGNWTCGTLLSAAQLDLTPVQGVPAVMDLDFLPDMGRMTGESRWDERIISSPDQTLAVSMPLRSTA